MTDKRIEFLKEYKIKLKIEKIYKHCKHECFDPNEEIGSCNKFKGYDYTFGEENRCHSLKEDPINGMECFEDEYNE